MPSINCWDNRKYEFTVEQTALLVIDMQFDFLSPYGRIAMTRGGQSPLSHIESDVLIVLNTARKCGMTVIHTREGYAPDRSDVNNLKRSMGYVGLEGANGPMLIRGTKGHNFLDAFTPLEGEYVIDKPGFSAFYGTTLDTLLRDKGVTHLIIMGITTQCCVHSTLRSATDRGYFCLTLEDCCAAIEQEVHDCTMRIIQAEQHLFGWISGASEFVKAVSD